MTVSRAVRMLFVVVMGLVSGGAAEALGQFTITGVVTDSVNGEPVPFSHLSLHPANTRQARVGRRPRLDGDSGVDADQHGRFVIAASGPGSWQLMAEARGFRAQSFEQHDFFSSAIVLSSARPSIDLNFRLVPDSVLSGFVLDEAGEAVRGAQVTVLAAPALDPEQTGMPAPVRSVTTTDDRGHFELASLSAGSYRLSVQGQPWYASPPVSRSGFGSGNPALDVVFPLTRFPGVTDRASAETLNLRPGEVRQVSFRLLPVPSTHLTLLTPMPDSGDEVRRRQGMPPVQVQPVNFELGMGSMPQTSMTADGRMEMSGFGPGLYAVRSQQTDGSENVRYLRVRDGGNNLDLGAATPAADVKIKFAGSSAGQHMDVSLTDPVTGDVFRSNSGGGLERRPRVAPAAAHTSAFAVGAELQAPPGEYNLALSGGREMFLAGISVGTGAVSVSRRVRVGAGTNVLTVHVAEGRGSLSGAVSAAGKPDVGSMVLLVPTSFGERGSIAISRRDQSNTDGSFEIEDIVPGQYILVAIDHGWEVNWRDPVTLQRFLLRGVPLTVAGAAQIKQNLVAIAP